MSIGLETVVQRSPDIMHVELDDHVIMLDVNADAYYELDPVGAEIWAMADNPIALTGVVEQIFEDFDVDHDQCLTDVLEFAKELVDEGILTVITGNP
ncbi:MAG: PqqD family protein [Acidimicrobiia bacterium]|nr:PqqD family protein [Acidimicrobiia bacterium]